MINNDRIVSVTAIDLLTNYSVILNAAGEELQKLDPVETGTFVMTEASGKMFLSEPVKTLDFGSNAAATFYFVPAFDFEGFRKGGIELTVSGDMTADARTLYKGVLSGDTVTVTPVGL